MSNLSPKSKQIRRNLAHLDLLCTLGNAIPTKMSIDMLERIVARVTITAMNLSNQPHQSSTKKETKQKTYLNRSIRGLTAQSIRPEIAHSHLITQLSFYGNPGLVLGLRHHPIHFPARLENQQPQHLHLRHELNNRKLHRLVIRQLLPLAPDRPTPRALNCPL